MECRLKCEKPEDIIYSMTITAKAKEWEELREMIEDKWPGFIIKNQITDLLSQARKIYWTENKE